MEYLDAFDSTKMNVEFYKGKNVVRFIIIRNRSFENTNMIDLNILELVKLRDELTDIIKSYGI